MKEKISRRKAMALLATENHLHALIAAGWAPSDLIAAGWTPSDLVATGWDQNDINAAKKEWDEIPIIPNLYTILLQDIEAGRRKHDQSLWGPDYDPKTNLCGTPMCTAGHLVNMAGEIGYKLKAKYNWTGAARMIHMKNRPDVLPQNFWAIPEKFAIAYIQERAAEEETKNNDPQIHLLQMLLRAFHRKYGSVLRRMLRRG